MKVLVDMCLSPRWVEHFAREGIEARHWVDLGDPRADDATILAAAREQGWVVFTHDLDFSRLLALGHASGPSVVQLRADDILPESVGSVVVGAIRQYAQALAEGALVVLDADRVRARILPIRGPWVAGTARETDSQ